MQLSRLGLLLQFLCPSGSMPVEWDTTVASSPPTCPSPPLGDQLPEKLLFSMFFFSFLRSLLTKSLPSSSSFLKLGTRQGERQRQILRLSPRCQSPHANSAIQKAGRNRRGDEVCSSVHTPFYLIFASATSSTTFSYPASTYATLVVTVHCDHRAR